ncbi:MAG: TetR/AcrR family transcriptional regulator [Robiginitomaculum sp.]|nr:TetR/AcrR family transcriptional regulator [Robiginitomaculum sp.]
MPSQADTCKPEPASPAERRHQRVRNSIIAAAEKMFAREGELAVSMRRLAEETDYSPAALYKYFGSKAEVFNAVRESFFERLITRIDHATENQHDACAMCRSTARAYIETALENPGTYLMSYSSWMDHRFADENSFGNLAAAKLESLIAHGIESGTFRQQDAALASKSVWAAVHGLTSLLLQVAELKTGIDGTQEYSNEDIIEFHINFMINGLRSDNMA